MHVCVCLHTFGRFGNSMTAGDVHAFINGCIERFIIIFDETLRNAHRACHDTLFDPASSSIVAMRFLIFAKSSARRTLAAPRHRHRLVLDLLFLLVKRIDISGSQTARGHAVHFQLIGQVVIDQR